MPGQRAPQVQHDVGAAVEVDGPGAQQVEDAPLAGEPDALVGGVGVDVLGGGTHEAEDDGLVAGVATAGGAERPEQVDLHAGDVRQEAGVGQLEDEAAGRPHRADRVRGRGADADREQVEGTERHEVPPVATRASQGRPQRRGARVVAARIGIHGTRTTQGSVRSVAPGHVVCAVSPL